MTDVFTQAAEARALQEDARLNAVFLEIEAGAVAVFKRALATPDEILTAHAKVGAVEVIRNAIQTRIDRAAFEQHKRDQHRG